MPSQLELRGRDNGSYADVSGTYAVIGPYQEGGFILDTPLGPRSVCRSAVCDAHLDHAALIRGEPEETLSFTIRVPQTTTLYVVGHRRLRFRKPRG